MRKFKNIIILFIFFFIGPFTIQAQDNIGIIDGIWFSKDVYYEGETIRVYTALQNHSGSDIKGTLNFINNGEVFSSQDVSILDNGVTELWADTVGNVGKNSFSTRLIDLKGSIPGADTKDLSARTVAIEKSVTTLPDKDRDGIADNMDKDKDPDDILNEEEIEKEISNLTIPKHVISLTEKYPIANKPVKLLSDFQKKALRITKKEKSRRVELMLISKTDSKSEKEVTPGIYDKVLDLSESIFSCFWCNFVLLVVIIYFVIKLLFRIIRSRD